MLDREELSRDVDISRREFAEGEGIPHEETARESLAFLDNLAPRKSMAQSPAGHSPQLAGQQDRQWRPRDKRERLAAEAPKI
jgi:hypothetical protein